ncbi:MAG TPA: dihydroorotate dehydrogenase electron transfer subunit [Mycobacteriales bacterium]|jgi:dihydroorotate dehydrogenase electron transfer subunit|nr:dihydroorotate dehydrogenase electron transfer subunit [Mycobacteriales bacterium]
MPIQVKGEVLNVKPIGDYFSMTVVAPGIAERTKPGQFVAVAVGGESGGMLLRRAFSIYSVRETGVYGGTVEFIFSVAGRGTAWLAAQRPYDPIDIVGPLGRPFALPREPANCVVVGGGYGAAPLFPLADALRTRGCRIDAVLGASTGDKLFGALDAKRMAASVAFTTDDGSYGEKGRVSDVLPEVIARVRADVVYACGPMAMLEAVQRVASEAYDGAGIPTQLSVEESMACGIGVCMTCVLPIIGNDGQTRMARSCVDGPVFGGDRIRWDALGTVPDDAVGAHQ